MFKFYRLNIGFFSLLNNNLYLSKSYFEISGRSDGQFVDHLAFLIRIQPQNNSINKGVFLLFGHKYFQIGTIGARYR